MTTYYAFLGYISTSYSYEAMKKSSRLAIHNVNRCLEVGRLSRVGVLNHELDHEVVQYN